MDLEYDQKFDEMKKYIPFLESMIKRLESTSPSLANPRQAQLDKIRSLRDLLLNKKKRMKMENLLKCEQVLINLYAKVEQRDTMTATKKAPDPGFAIDPPTPQEKSDLEAVRNKLKTVVQRQEVVQETLPEILRVNEVEEMRTAGTKEPALFQRRPNKTSLSPTRSSPSHIKEEKHSPPSTAAKRNYTRVLVSPESSSRRWSSSETTEDKPLFSRRSPRRSPRRHSPSYHKKERKKSSKETSSRKSKDLNITLNVPEDSLSTLNTKDIFTRIINCRDGDVDIDTLRELRKQILTELQKTGARDDISDLILKSYSRNKKRKSKKKEEVEEGELSDSESEVIQNVYGNLVLKDENETKTSSDKDKARKIQICLVINSDTNVDSNTSTNVELPKTSDISELEMYNNDDKENSKTKTDVETTKDKVINTDEDEVIISDTPNIKADIKNDGDSTDQATAADPQNLKEETNSSVTPKDSVQNQANFYKPITDNSESVKSNEATVNKNAKQSENPTESDKKPETDLKVSTSDKNVCDIERQLETMEDKPIEIPLLNEPTIPATPTNDTVSEIDILQALKNEILSESLTIPGAKTTTPLLHQPKVNKVASAKEILPKKRISIEKYKQKSVNPSKLFLDEYDSSKDDLIKKPSLKLTEKECERFNFPKISFDDDSSDDNDSEIQASDLYSDLAPKSPEHDESSNINLKSPVIIPVDPVKSMPASYKADVDMRRLPSLSPTNVSKAPMSFSNNSMLVSQESSVGIIKDDTKIDLSKVQNRPILDPRVREKLNSRTNNQSPSPHTTNPDRPPRPLYSNMNQSPSSNVVLTPNARSFEMTPSHQTFEIDHANKKHVYVPSFTTLFDSRDRESSVSMDSREKIESARERISRLDDIGDNSCSSSDVSTRHSDSFTGDKYNKGQRNERFTNDNRDFCHKRLECPKTPIASFGRSDVPCNSTQQFGRLEPPMTPLHPFGRTDCPTTPSHPFGRSDVPTTLNNPFGNPLLHVNEGSLTPSHTFGAECPQTPTPFFGRNDCPSTPNHPFGMSDGPPAPNHPISLLEPSHHFGRSDVTTNMYGRSDFINQKYTKDPRLHRNSEYESNSQFDERDRSYYKDHGYYRGSSYKHQNYKNQERDGRNSKYRYYAQDQSGRQNNKDHRREQSLGRSTPKDYENEGLFTRERNRLNNDRSYKDIGSRLSNARERSVGRDLYGDQYEKTIRNKGSHVNLNRSSSKALSVGRDSAMQPENTLSVKPEAGRLFTIDTSVNATFQRFLESGKGIQVFEYNFDARRQRAASVGRSLVRESSVGRVLSDSTQQKSVNENKGDIFRRASSVGRDLVDSFTKEKSFQEIKADFKTYRHPVKKVNIFDTGKIRNIDTKSKNTTENIARRKQGVDDKYKQEQQVQNTNKLTYSPRRNCRDPRMRRENDVKNKYNYGDPRAKKIGIVYSNDNIVKGAILTSGYGVKNYKIPKIKRVIEVKEAEPLKKDETCKKKDEKEINKNTNVEKSKDQDTVKDERKKEKVKDITKSKSNEVSKGKGREIPKNKIKETCKEKIKDSDAKSVKSEIEEEVQTGHVQRRLTRSSRKVLEESETVTDVITKTRKPKKSIISDSDSDTDTSVTQKKPENDEKICSSLNIDAMVSPVKVKNVPKKPNAVDIDTNFGLDELEMFSDNIVSDPVIDNINALIADLDNDLNSSKPETSDNFTKEISLETMMKNISSPQEPENFSQISKEFSNALQAVEGMSKLSNQKTVSLSDFKTENEVCDKVGLENIEERNDKMLTIEPVDISLDSNNVEQKQNESLKSDKPDTSSKHSNEDIVSTTAIEKDLPLGGDALKVDDPYLDGASTPDSTINTDEVLEKPKCDDFVDDSRNEDAPGETNVTSTDSVEPKPRTIRTETAPTSDLGNLLTILQDKSKIKELLSMLGDQSGDNDKIKKKLEKLSEIVSDDEVEEKTEQLEEGKGKESVSIDDKTVDKNQVLNEKPDIIDTKVEVAEKIAKSDKEETKDEKEVELNKDETDQEKDENLDDDFVDEESVGNEDTELPMTKRKNKNKVSVKKSKVTRKGKGRFGKKKVAVAEKRVTRATAAVETKQKSKKPTRELQKLHEDIKEMFIKDDILSATGIRMCRLAKMVDEKPTKEDVIIPEVEPVVVLEKFKNSDKNPPTEKVKKKTGPKPKAKISVDTLPETKDKSFKYKPGPKSKTKNKRESDPYAFETESVEETEKASDDDSDSSDSDIGSLASLQSFGSSEVLADIKKKPKRKRRGWQDGVIKPKHKKKKVDSTLDLTPELLECNSATEKPILIPDMNCFTDKNYCFRKNESSYSCRLCEFSGTDIVHHYKNEHPHVEIPLSRMAATVAKEAIDQCKEINFQAVSRISSEKYICIFCFQEFHHNNSVLETFFWHVVSMHTGEYKHTCSECISESKCPFSLDIPPPPKEVKGQLIGYICKKCNFTQLSLENLKTHVIVRHNDEQTAVYTINLAAMSKKALKDFLRRCEAPDQPMSRQQKITAKRLSKETDQVAEIIAHGSESEVTQHKKTTSVATIQSKITFEADDNVSEYSDMTSEGPSESTVKIERVDTENMDEILHDELQSNDTNEPDKPAKNEDQHPILPLHVAEQLSSPTIGSEDLRNTLSNDILDYPHFKINITETGVKEYICCINGKDKHFKTTLLISMKKHVQLKHSENWDGYCFVCKVIVTPQGAHRFKDCLQHYLDKHMDSFPILELSESTPNKVPDTTMPKENPAAKPFINVRPICELISGTVESTPKETTSFPIIQSVVSLGETLSPNPSYPTVGQSPKPLEVIFKYEEVQAKVMSNKHRVVLETMMARDKLIKVYKCAGRFCSFTSDSAEDALLHASTHQRIGGIDALNCSYCDFNAMGNAIDLVMHVFKAHGHCQYSCAQCFYRAAASQSVGAHMYRVHGAAPTSGPVLRTTIVPSNASAKCEILTREQAVPHFFCNHGDGGAICKFRTYTPDKFCEHLKQKHSGATSHSCHSCQAEFSSPTDLIQHMKTHGLKLYQCTWCVFGADNESELLTHVSSLHPEKQPQAYVRIITNKEGTNELRVLPLAFLNKLKVLTEDVTPSTTKENPVREAERSIDLEKLISLTMIVEPSEPEPPATQPAVDTIPDPVAEPITLVNANNEIETPSGAPVSNASATIVSPRPSDTASGLGRQQSVDVLATDNPPQNVPETFPVKLEPLETPKTLPGEVVVLDSDDEEPKQSQSVIDLSDEETTSSSTKAYTNKRVPFDILGTCPKCRQVCKTMNGLKKHLHYCYPNKEQGCRCAHCPYLASNRDNILQHYMDDHCDKNIYQCGVCRLNLMTLPLVKRHLKNVHKEKYLIVTSTVENGLSCISVNVAPKEKRELPKRKLSASNTTTSPPATTSTTSTEQPKRRFQPQEINQLPINPILDQLVYCAICEFSTKVRLNMVRHLQFHAEQQPVAQTAPVNPVPHLETNEKHFDKMLNLASSSIVNRTPEKPQTEKGSFVAVQMSAELVARYPKQISARQRNTCGAIGCLYTSVDEPMLKRHWEALHSGSVSSNFRCVHCPNNQITDTSKPITASRVIAHLKMHDDTLYACSKCNFYHFKRDILVKHLTELHPNGQLMIVRENASATAAATTAVAPPPSTGPTMDLKPWQCGLCKFKSMLRPEVADHCFKQHQSKMQYRCGYCPYRASAIDNVNNHLAHSHANEPEEVIYYYYREGSLPDAEDGTPRWIKQRHKLEGNTTEVKTEYRASPIPSPTPAPVNIDLNLVKKEVDDEVNPHEEQSLEDLCKRFGDFCEPNGIKFKCPLCNVVSEDTKEAMQSHLYEELKYRKWSCGLCSYKAFHKAGLTEHMTIEHRRQYDHIQLPADANIEKWVTGQLDYQASIIEKYKTNLAKQKIQVERSKPSECTVPSLTSVPSPVIEPVEKYSEPQLVEAFGEFGAPTNLMYCCPKCETHCKDETTMRDHLEMELNKIRWGCSNCSVKYQTYHEAQFHCKGHDGPSRPKEAVRDPSMRAAWVTNIIQSQKKILESISATSTSLDSIPEKNVLENDNSLLVVRYEERVPTPDLVPVRRKRRATQDDSDDEKLVIAEVDETPKKSSLRSCKFCEFTCKSETFWKEHVLKHYNLKPYSCDYCPYSGFKRRVILLHTQKEHPNQVLRIKVTGIPPDPSYVITSKSKHPNNPSSLICLFCEKSIPETEVSTHLHEKIRPDFARKGDVVVKCCICLVLRLDVKSLQDHHNLAHPDIPINYALFRLHTDSKEMLYCSYCDYIGFQFLKDLKAHHNEVHPALLFKFKRTPYFKDNEGLSKKENLVLEPKRCARKSTTKLPGCKAIAKKSTTKLPYTVPDTSNDGYSYYKTKPASLDEYANVTTLMSFCNRMMPFTLKKLSEIINIEPIVVVNDIKAENSSDDDA